MSVATERCARCGNATIVSGACASCGAGVKYVLPFRRGRRKKRDRACRHVWNYLGVTFEHGSRQRKERCGKCPALRFVDLGDA